MWRAGDLSKDRGKVTRDRSEQKPIKNFGKSSVLSLENLSGHVPIYRYRANRTVIFAVAHPSCFSLTSTCSPVLTFLFTGRDAARSQLIAFKKEITQ